jgi:hypothetical protein
MKVGAEGSDYNDFEGSRVSQEKRMGIASVKADTAITSIRKMFARLQAATEQKGGSIVSVSDEEIVRTVHDYITTRIRIGGRTKLGHEIFGLDVLLEESHENLNVGVVWAIAQSAMSVPKLLPPPLIQCFTIGLCFWEFFLERSLDQGLSLGDQAAPTAGRKAVTKFRLHIVTQVFDSYLLTATTSTNQNREIKDVDHISEAELAHHFIVADSKNSDRVGHTLKDHKHCHSPLFVDTIHAHSQICKGVRVNAAVAYPCSPSVLGSFAGIMEQESCCALLAGGKELRRARDEVLPLKGRVDFGAIEASKPPSRSVKSVYAELDTIFANGRKPKQAKGGNEDRVERKIRGREPGRSTSGTLVAVAQPSTQSFSPSQTQSGNIRSGRTYARSTSSNGQFGDINVNAGDVKIRVKGGMGRRPSTVTRIDLNPRTQRTRPGSTIGDMR